MYPVKHQGDAIAAKVFRGQLSGRHYESWKLNDEMVAFGEMLFFFSYWQSLYLKDQARCHILLSTCVVHGYSKMFGGY